MHRVSQLTHISRSSNDHDGGRRPVAELAVHRISQAGPKGVITRHGGNKASGSVRLPYSPVAKTPAAGRRICTSHKNPLAGDAALQVTRNGVPTIPLVGASTGTEIVEFAPFAVSLTGYVPAELKVK